MINLKNLACSMAIVALMQPSVNAQRAPPKGGKFFYMDYGKEDT